MARLIEKLRVFLKLIIKRTRSRILSLRGANISRKVNIGSRVVVDRPWALCIGSRATIEDDVYFKIVADRARLDIGKYTFIGKGCEFDVLESVAIGDNTLIAPGCFITDHDHGTDMQTNIDTQPCVAAPVSIGKDVWLGAKCIILPGITVANGAVVGANAVVTKNVAEMDIVAGVPARKIGSRSIT
jgi:acetyltransferase-like isoleucine patch superfamily enzyme